MICYFCNGVLKESSIGNGNTKKYIVYCCEDCLPNHRTVYRELYNLETSEIMRDLIRIDDYSIFRNYCDNTTIFNKDAVINLNDDFHPKFRIYPVSFYEMVGIWNITFNDANAFKQKLQIYTTFL